jgi:Cu(I)/Ag(I) efflux system membrane fusion protein
MKKSILIVILLIGVTITFNSCKNSTSNSTAVASKTADKEIYTCSMHPEVRSDKPGNCPKCGMKLVKMEAGDTAKMNDHPDTTMKMK